MLKDPAGQLCAAESKTAATRNLSVLRHSDQVQRPSLVVHPALRVQSSSVNVSQQYVQAVSTDAASLLGLTPMSSCLFAEMMEALWVNFTCTRRVLEL